MTLKDTIDRFSHLDIVLGDPAWCADSLPWTTAHDLWVAAKAGQAEIDDLTERNAFLLTSAETAQAKLAEARAEVERRDTYIAELAQKLDKLTAKGKELEWARGVIGRYETRLQEQSDLIDRYRVTAIAHGQGREPTFGELASHRHIATERYEG